MAWLIEGRLTVVILLAAVAIVLAFIWWQTRKREWLLGLGVVGALLGLYLLVDVLFDTDQEADRKQIQARIEAYPEAIREMNANKLFEHVADDFRSPQGRSRQQCLEFADSALKHGQITELRVWDIRFEEDLSRTKGTTRVLFSFNAKAQMEAPQGVPFDCEATYRYDSSRGWLLTRVRILKFGTTEDIPVPF
jgi:hypothetical protein